MNNNTISEEHSNRLQNVINKIDELETELVTIIQEMEIANPTPPTADMSVEISELVDVKDLLYEAITILNYVISPF